MTHTYFCWDCMRPLHKNEVEVTDKAYICKRCGSEAVDEIEYVSKDVLKGE